MNEINKPITGNVLKHAQHIEDGVIFSKENADLSFRTLESTYETLKGNTPEGSKVSTKVDGAPSVSVASDFNGKTFVCYKSALESIVSPQVDKKTGLPKEPDYSKICYTEEDCDRVYVDPKTGLPDGKNPKMKALLKYAKSIGIPKNEIWQGDFMFSKEDLFYQEFEGEERICFHPNTIVYTVSLDDPLAQRIKNAEHCVIWHTKYTGSEFGNLRISFNVDAKKLPENKEFLSLDANIDNIAGSVTLTEEETDLCESKLKEIRNGLDDLFKDSFYSSICSTSIFKDELLTFMNSLIKGSSRAQFVDNFTEKFVDWECKKLDEKIMSYKTEKSRVKAKEAKQEFIKTVFDHKDTFDNIVEVQKNMVLVKELLEKKLNNIPQKYKNYVIYKSTGAIVPVGQEGFCVSDIDGNIQKVVSRLSFSLNNFDPDILKGWESDRRNRQYLKEYLINEASENEKVADELDKEFSDNDIKLRRRNLPSKNIRSKEIKKFSVEVEPTEEISRKDAAETFVDTIKTNNKLGKTNTYVVNEVIPNDNNRPIITIRPNELDYHVELNFKDIKTLSKFNAQDTEEMEVTWAKIMSIVNKNFILGIDPKDGIPSLEEMKKGFGKISKSWYKSFIEGSIYLLDPKNKYVDNDEYLLFRMDSNIDTDEKVNESIHTLINNIFDNHKKIFGNRGNKDSWNPSDIYLCRKSKYSDIVNRLKDLDKNIQSFGEINSFLWEELDSKNLIGVSLKQIGSLPNVEEVSTPSDIENSIKNYTIKFISIPEFTINALGKKPGKQDISIKLEYTENGNTKELNLRCRQNNGINNKTIGSPIRFNIPLSKSQVGWCVTWPAIIAREEINVSDVTKSDAIEESKNLFCLNDKVNEIVSSGIEHIYLESFYDFSRRTSTLDYEKLSIEDKYYLALWPRIIRVLLVLSRAYKNETLNEVLNEIINGCNKRGSQFAPLLRLE